MRRARCRSGPHDAGRLQISGRQRYPGSARRIPYRGIWTIFPRMTRTRIWIETTGGPHLLIPAEQLSCWRGIEGWRDHADPADQSDYARACRVTSWLGSIGCGGGVAVVLSDEAGDVAWYADDRDDRGFLVQWLGVDDEQLIAPVLKGYALRSDLDRVDAERLEFKPGRPASRG